MHGCGQTDCSSYSLSGVRFLYGFLQHVYCCSTQSSDVCGLIEPYVSCMFCLGAYRTRRACVERDNLGVKSRRPWLLLHTMVRTRIIKRGSSLLPLKQLLRRVCDMPVLYGTVFCSRARVHAQSHGEHRKKQLLPRWASKGSIEP